MGLGFAVFAGTTPEIIRASAREAEQLGYSSFWVNHPGSTDGLAALAQAARETQRIELGIGVIPLHSRGPENIVQGVSANALPLDRLLLGVGSPNPKARHRADIYRPESINVGTRKRRVIFPRRVPESMALKIRRRSRLRRKEATDFLGRLRDEFGMAVPLDDVPLDEAEAGPHRLLLRGDDAIAIFLDGGIAPTIRGLLAFPAKKRAVTVDMGAVRFIYNGADVMAPGIVEADPGIRAGDVVWVRDEKNGPPLAIGRAVMDGPTMAREAKGQAIQTIHHPGAQIRALAARGP